MISGIDPKVDYSFKRIFGSGSNSAPLIRLLNAVLSFPAGKTVRRVRITNPLTEKDFAEEKVSILDVRAVDQAQRRFNLEMQRIVPWVFAKRALYYWAGLHSEQLLEGDYHQTLCSTYSVCLLEGSLFPDDVYHHKFQVVDGEHGVLLCPDLEIHTLELNKFTLEGDEVQTPLQQWCYFLKHGAELDSEKLPAFLNLPEIRQALEVLNMLSQDEIERSRYQSRRKTERDEASLRYAAEHAQEEGREAGREEGLEEGLKEGIEKGLKEGIEKGLKEGIEKGLEEGLKEGLEKGLEEGLGKGELVGRIHLAQRILKQPLRAREELLRLSLDELMRLADALEQQLLSGSNGTP